MFALYPYDNVLTLDAQETIMWELNIEDILCSGVIRTITKNLLSLTLSVFMCYQNHHQESSFSYTLCVHVLAEPLPRIFFL